MLLSLRNTTFSLFFVCTGGETRTPDTWFWRPVLCQLSYTRILYAKCNFYLAIANIVIHSKLPKQFKSSNHQCYSLMQKVINNHFQAKIHLNIQVDLTAEKEGFEPPVPRGTTVFKTAAFDHSAISPERDKSRIIFQTAKAFLYKKLNNCLKIKVRRFVFSKLISEFSVSKIKVR